MISNRIPLLIFVVYILLCLLCQFHALDAASAKNLYKKWYIGSSQDNQAQLQAPIPQPTNANNLENDGEIGDLELRPLVLPDATNTYLKMNQTTLDYLSSLPAPLHIMTIAGRAKTGKSFLMNKILQKKAFDVGLSFKPGTKGIWVWGPETIMRRRVDPKSNIASFEKLSVLYLDTEGLGAPGNPADSYDPKLCAISVLISSLIMYNVKSEIQVDDVNLLHSVAILSTIFEKSLPGEKFPFPPMLWTVQQFQHDLEGESPDSYLDWVLQEKPNVLNRRDIEVYNETIRVVKQFPSFDTRILLMEHPATGSSLPEVSNLLWKELGATYRRQVNQLRRFVHEKIEAKSFNGVLVSGKVIVELLRELVPELNSIDAPNVGPALVRQLSFALRDQLFEKYQIEMEKSIQLPANIDKLDNAHLHWKKTVLQEFHSRCTGSMEAQDNIRAYEELKNRIDSTYAELLKRNTLLTNIASNQLINEIFTDLAEMKYSSVDSFEEDIERRYQKYLSTAKGDRLLVQKTLEEYKTKAIQLKRSLVLHDNSNKDLGQMLAMLGLIFIFSYLSTVLASFTRSQVVSQFFTSLCTISFFTGLFVLSTFHRFLDVINFQIIEFEQLQYWFLGLKKLLTFYGALRPFFNLFMTVSKLFSPYHVMVFVLLFASILAWKAFSLCREHQRSNAVIRPTTFSDILVKGKTKKAKTHKFSDTSRKHRVYTHYSDTESDCQSEYHSDQENRRNPFQECDARRKTYVSSSISMGRGDSYTRDYSRDGMSKKERRHGHQKEIYSPLHRKRIRRYM